MLGSLKIKRLGTIDSTILSMEQMNQLLGQGIFSSNQKWKLLYRASKDGMNTIAFRLKFDKQKNVLIIFKSTLGHVFGG